MVQGVCPGIGSEFERTEQCMQLRSRGMSLDMAAGIKGSWPLDDSSPHRVPEQAGAWDRGSTDLAVSLVERSRLINYQRETWRWGPCWDLLDTDGDLL